MSFLDRIQAGFASILGRGRGNEDPTTQLPTIDPTTLMEDMSEEERDVLWAAIDEMNGTLPYSRKAPLK